MSKKKKRPLPPRTLRMNHHGRLQSARRWLATQRGRPANRIARSYRKRYRVDWTCAIVELSALGIAFDPKWRERINRTLEEAKRAQARRREEQKAARARPQFSDSDENFAFIVGYSEGGAPFGVTREESEKIEHDEHDAPIEQPLVGDAPEQHDDDAVPF